MEENKKEKKKFKLWEKIFVCLSFLMVILVVIIYGTRFIHYYMIEHPKNVDNSIAGYIKRGKTVLSGDGLYTFDENNYYYYGKDVNNYLWYSGRLWQIIDITLDGLKLITYDNQTSLVFGINSDYDTSYVNKWLNVDKYINTLNKEDLVNYNWCIDSFEINNVKCSEIYQNYIGLLSISDYLRAGGKDSFLNNSLYFWTSNSNDNKEYYVFSDGGINNTVSSNDTYYSYGVRPVIVLKNNYTYYGGDGTKENPYQVENNDSELISLKNIGDYVSFSNYTWRIQNKVNDSVMLIMDGYVNDKEYSYSKALDYLNHEFLNSLPKDKLNKCDFSNDTYGKNSNYDYANVSKKKVNNYVGVSSVGDLFINNYINAWLNNAFDGGSNLQYKTDAYTYIADVNSNNNRLVPVICIKNDTLVSDGVGTKESPYQVGE